MDNQQLDICEHNTQNAINKCAKDARLTYLRCSLAGGDAPCVHLLQ